MTTPMNDPNVISFMTVFCELYRRMKDDPSKLRIMSANDDTLAKLCADLQFAGLVVRLDNRACRKRFREPLNNEFAMAWREYEECWEPVVLDVVSDYIFASFSARSMTKTLPTWTTFPAHASRALLLRSKRINYAQM